MFSLVSLQMSNLEIFQFTKQTNQIDIRLTSESLVVENSQNAHQMSGTGVFSHLFTLDIF